MSVLASFYLPWRVGYPTKSFWKDSRGFATVISFVGALSAGCGGIYPFLWTRMWGIAALYLLLVFAVSYTLYSFMLYVHLADMKVGVRQREVLWFTMGIGLCLEIAIGLMAYLAAATYVHWEVF